MKMRPHIAQTVYLAGAALLATGQSMGDSRSPGSAAESQLLR